MFFFALLSVLCLTQAAQLPTDVTTFEDFKVLYNKQYANAEAEAHARENFEANLKYIQENNNKHGFQLGLNDRADLAENEFGLMTNFEIPALTKPANLSELLPLKDSLPSQFNWHTKSGLNGIQNQGSCGSCWAFGTATVTEAVYKIFKGQQVLLSKQQLVDCDSTTYGYRNYGCSGGFPTDAMSYIRNVGLVEEKHYRYTARVEYCINGDLNFPRYKIASFNAFAEETDDQTLMAAMYKHGPLVISVNASPDNFRFYRSGVMRNFPRYGNINHVITLVGWGEQNGEKYWIVQNSWGNSWGMSGFGYLERGQNWIHVNDYAIYATL